MTTTSWRNFWAACVCDVSEVTSESPSLDFLASRHQGVQSIACRDVAMMAEFRARSAPLLDAFLKRVPAAEKAVRAYLAEMKRSS